MIDVPGPVAALVRPREAGGLVVATEAGVVLLDEHDAPSHRCEILDEPGMRMNDGGCDPQGRFSCGSMASITTSRLEVPDGVDAAAGSLFRCTPGVRGQAVAAFAG